MSLSVISACPSYTIMASKHLAIQLGHIETLNPHAIDIPTQARSKHEQVLLGLGSAGYRKFEGYPRSFHSNKGTVQGETLNESNF